MATLVIDTHKFVEKLVAAGVPKQQAEAIVEGLRETSLDQVATTADIATVREEILNFKAELFKWAVPVLIGQVAVFAIVMKWLGGA